METDVFGLTINYKSWCKTQSLPLYIFAKRRDQLDLFFNLCSSFEQ